VTKIILVRHGHVEGIHPPRFRGREDLPLTKRGKAEALAVAQRVVSKWQPARVFTSPLSRCVETGSAIAKACGIEAKASAATKASAGCRAFRAFRSSSRNGTSTAAIAVPIMSDGREGPALELRPLFDQFHTEAR
jgi:broad specificity phosphatase PhoE